MAQGNTLKLYKSAPLPFVGQKRNFVNDFIRIINESIQEDGANWTIIDAFGGSGLLAHVSKRIKPAATVIYNDFDDYHKRLVTLPATNQLRQQLAVILDESPRSKKLDVKTKQAVMECLHSFEGSIDMRTVSTWLLFSGNHANTLEELSKCTLYNTLRRTDINEPEHYLQGLNIVKTDFETLLKEHYNNPRCLFVLDPPYTCTQQGMYSNDSYFGMVEFLRLMQFVRPPFVFFSSTRSEFIDYVNFVIDTKVANFECLEGYKRIAINTTINHSSKYEDNLVYKFS